MNYWMSKNVLKGYQKISKNFRHPRSRSLLSLSRSVRSLSFALLSVFFFEFREDLARSIMPIGFLQSELVYWENFVMPKKKGTPLHKIIIVGAGGVGSTPILSPLKVVWLILNPFSREICSHSSIYVWRFCGRIWPYFRWQLSEKNHRWWWGNEYRHSWYPKFFFFRLELLTSALLLDTAGQEDYAAVAIYWSCCFPLRF